MNLTQLKSDYLLKQRNIFVLISILLFLIDFFLAVAVFSRDTTTVIIPMDLTHQMSVSSKKPSNEYLEAMTRDILTTIFNLNPNNTEYAEKVLLSLSYSSSLGKLKNDFRQLKDQVIAKKINTVFYPKYITPNANELTVSAEGEFKIYFGEKQISNEPKKYIVKYHYQLGKLNIQDIYETEIEEIQDKRVNNK